MRWIYRWFRLAQQRFRLHRVTSQAGALAFFALFALPPALLVVAGVAGYLGAFLGPDAMEAVEDQLSTVLGSFIRTETMEDLVQPALKVMFEQGRAGLLSLGTLLAVWSASRMVKVLIESMNIAYSVEEWRDPWRRRVLSIVLTVSSLILIGTFLPLLVAGPLLARFVGRMIGLQHVGELAWSLLYWPLLAAVSIGVLLAAYRLAPNWHAPLMRHLPGALLAAGSWLVASFLLRIYTRFAISETTFGPLAAPLVVMVWLYVTALAIIAGAELNAALEGRWPSESTGPKSDPVGLEANDT